MTNRNILRAFAPLALSLTAHSASADNTLQSALDGDAEQLVANEIAERFVGQTGTWVSGDGARKIEIFYGEDNALFASPVDEAKQRSGFYGITDTDRICISWDGGNDRLRCLDVVESDGTVAKYNANGSLNGTYAQFTDGRSF
jgi:hypothetical protein